MLKDFFESFVGVLSRSVSAAEKVRFVPRPAGLPGQGWLTNGEGEILEEVDPVKPPRDHFLSALVEMQGAIQWAAFKRRAAALGQMEVSEADVSDPTSTALALMYDPLKLSVWHDERGAVLIIDDDGCRASKVTLTLDTTEIWEALNNLDKNCAKMDHRQFMSLLRFTLCPYMEPVSGGALLEAAKVIDFGTQTSGTSAQSRNQSGFGLDVRDSVKSRVGELPDEILVQVPIYNDSLLNERVSVRLSIEINPQDKSFKVSPLIDELPNASRQVMTTMRNILESFAHSQNDGSRMAFVFYGTPQA